MGYNISGIQQMGIGVNDAEEGFKWYNRHFGMDIPVFKSAGKADLMQYYTGGRGWERYAILAINIQGGGGFEIWQHTERKPLSPKNSFQLGDLGINIARIKCKNVDAFHKYCVDKKLDVLNNVSSDPSGAKHFYLKDPYGNIFDIAGSTSWFVKNRRLTGGVSGAVMGVADMDKSIAFYSSILGYDQKIYDETGTFSDLAVLPGGDRRFRRVMLKHSKPRSGPFSKLLGDSNIELVQSLDRQVNKIYEGRFWGDLGYIHLCFDVSGMEDLRKTSEAAGHPFTVDSRESFKMDDAAGHFIYMEDPDGALIEFVETHKVPIFKKWGWYLDLKKRNPLKPLPKWMLKALSMNRVKL